MLSEKLCERRVQVVDVCAVCVCVCVCVCVILSSQLPCCFEV